MERIAVLGGGSWGTALAVLLAGRGHDVLLWGRGHGHMYECEARRENLKYLPGATFPSTLHATSDLQEALEGRATIVSVVPSQSTRAVWQEAAPFVRSEALVVSASKGIENGSLSTMDEVLHEVAPQGTKLAFLSSPSFAREVGQSLPTAVVMTSADHAIAERAGELFRAERFRVYTSDDVVGVEMGGALKNVMAIAAGAVTGMQLGYNPLAAMITRGLAEITRLAVAKGAHPMTLAGLAGIGDLVLTCTGGLSRNRAVGHALGEGKTLQEAIASVREVAEGVVTAKSAYELAQKLDVDAPITSAVYKVLYEGVNIREAVAELIRRRPKRELEY